jgi:hypothetical protein
MFAVLALTVGASAFAQTDVPPAPVQPGKGVENRHERRAEHRQERHEEKRENRHERRAEHRQEKNVVVPATPASPSSVK